MLSALTSYELSILNSKVQSLLQRTTAACDIYSVLHISCIFTWSAAPSEPSPSFGIIFLVNFTAIDPAASGKVPDRRCSINYGKYFIHQVVSLAENIAAVPRPTWFKFDGPNSYCANSAINVTVSVKNISSNVYFSEYSRVFITELHGFYAYYHTDYSYF
jgi:hypothetical protein